MGKNIVIDIISLIPHNYLLKMNINLLDLFWSDGEWRLVNPLSNTILKGCSFFLVNNMRSQLLLIHDRCLLMERDGESHSVWSIQVRTSMCLNGY